MLLLFLLFVGMTLAVFGVFAKDLPDPNKINSRDVEQSTQIMDRNGKLLYSVHGDKNRTLIALEDIPINCRNAIIVKEDKDFYKHHGIVPRSIVRAFRANVLRVVSDNGRVEGGSTITQQLVKNVLLTPERSIQRKVKEVVLAIEIEQLYKKDDILKIYMNEIPFGSNAYGIQAAATTFFGKDAKALTLEECAALAALPQAPTYYSPYGQRKDELLATKDFILDGMVSEGYIKQEEADAAKKAPVSFQPPRENILAPHFVLWVREALVKKYGEKEVYEGGLKVTTTLDYNIQLIGEKAIADNLSRLHQRGASNASLVAVDPKTGQVLAMVGSANYFDQNIDGNVNVSLTLQQPGSSGKPYVYASMFKDKDRFGRYWSPGSILYDVETNFGTYGGKEYRPKNFDRTDLHSSQGIPGAITIRNALGNSLNIPAVRALYITGVENAINTMRDFGIKSSNISAQNCGLSLVLGGCDVTLLEHTSGYATFASLGVHHDLASVLKIEDSKGKVIHEYKDSSRRVIDPQIPYLLADILKDRNARVPEIGTRLFHIPAHPNIAAKSGTSNDEKTGQPVDAWTMAFNPNLAAGIWAGNNDNRPLRAGSATIAEPIWRSFWDAYMSGKPNDWYSAPSGIKTVTLDNLTGGVPRGASHTDIAPSFFEVPDIEAGGSFVVDIVSGGRATSCTPEAAKQSRQASRVVPEIGSSDPAFSLWAEALRRIGGGAGASPTFDDNIHKCSDDLPEINIIQVRKNLATNKITIKYSLTKGTHSITGGTANGSSKVHIKVGGTEIASIAAPGNSGTYCYSYNSITTTPGTQVQLTVFDSVLYSDSSNTVNLVSGTDAC